MLWLLPALFIFLIGLLVEIFFLKFSAEKAYKIKVTYEKAFLQWIWLLILRIALWVILATLMLILLLPLLVVGG